MYKLIKNGLILLLILNSLTAVSKTTYEEAIWKNIYSPSEEIRDLSFELHTDDLARLVNEKVITNQIENIHLKYYWLQNKNEIVLITDSKINEEVATSIKKQLTSKIDIIVGSIFDDYIKGYEFKEVSSGWYKWIDPSGLKDINEKSIKRRESEIDIIEKKSIGTTRANYKFKKFPWSNNKLVLTNISYKSYEGVQSIEVDTKIEYQKIEQFWVPSALEVETKQQLNKNNPEGVSREFKESFEFRSYIINKKSALEWFSKN